MDSTAKSSQFGVDLADAKRHRERDLAETDRFYDQQARAVAQWQWGEPKPVEVILGDLPIVCPKRIRIDSD